MADLIWVLILYEAANLYVCCVNMDMASGQADADYSLIKEYTLCLTNCFHSVVTL